MKDSNTPQEALQRAVSSPSLSNYPTIYQEFAARGIPESEILPRENVFTFQAWKAKGRHVRKGEKGVRIFTRVNGSKTDRDTGESVGFSFPKSTHVFHVSQTDAN